MLPSQTARFQLRIRIHLLYAVNIHQSAAMYVRIFKNVMNFNEFDGSTG